MKNEEELYKEKCNDIKEFDDLNSKENILKKNIYKNEININRLNNNIKNNKKKEQNYSKIIKLYEEYLKISNEIKNLKKNNKTFNK